MRRTSSFGGMMKTVTAAATAASLFSGVEAFWRMSCGVIQTGRIDPIVNPGTVGGHVHKISGPPNFSPSSNFDSLSNSRCTSCSVQADKSAYWTPLMYYQHRNGSFEEVPADGQVIYYLGRGENSSNIQAFPKEFRMLSGNPAVRSYDNSTYTYGGPDGVIYTGGHCQTGDGTCVGGRFVPRTGTKSDPPGPIFKGRPVSDRVSYACLDSSPSPETPSLSHTQCANGLRAQVHFPSCWDGINSWSAGNAHVDYMSQIDNGVCPPSHPILLPHLFYEVLYGVANVIQDGGRFAFSMGDPTGYGFHADFLNGWNPDVLNQAIKQCINGNANGVISDCAPLAASNDDNSGFNCPPQPAYYDEPVRGMIGKALPGCNKVTFGPASAVPSDNVCPPNTPLPTQNTTYNFSAGGVATYPKIGSAQNGYTYIGCFQDDSGHSFSTVSTNDIAMTNAKCQSFCASKNLPLAATEYSTECYCGYSLNATVNPNITCNGMVCGGNSSEFCGGSRLLSVYNSTSYKGSYNPVMPQPSQDIGNGYTYLGCASEASNGRALNITATGSLSNMTNDVCAKYCIGQGQPLFGTEYGSECYCGSALASGSSLGQVGCNMGCSGTSPSSGPFASWANTCGGPSRLNVWRYNKVSVSSSASDTLKSAVSVMSVPGTSTASSKRDAAATLKPTSISLSPDSAINPSSPTQLTSKSASASAKSTPDFHSSTASASVTNTGVLPSPSTPIGKNITFLGCAREPDSGRILNITSTSAPNMTNEMCAKYCASQSLPLFGTEYGRECYCGNALAPGSFSSGDASTNSDGANDCSMPCAGSQPTVLPFAAVANLCGGPSRLTAWNNTSIKPVSNKASVSATRPTRTYTYHGCYAEGVTNGRGLNMASYSDSDSSSTGPMTVDRCVSFCSGQGFAFAGTEYSRQCFCGNSLANGAKKANEWECNMQCAGDMGSWCGGSARLSVYSVN